MFHVPFGEQDFFFFFKLRELQIKLTYHSMESGIGTVCSATGVDVLNQLEQMLS